MSSAVQIIGVDAAEVRIGPPPPPVVAPVHGIIFPDVHQGISQINEDSSGLAVVLPPPPSSLTYFTVDVDHAGEKLILTINQPGGLIRGSDDFVVSNADGSVQTTMTVQGAVSSSDPTIHVTVPRMLASGSSFVWGDANNIHVTATDNSVDTVLVIPQYANTLGSHRIVVPSPDELWLAYYGTPAGDIRYCAMNGSSPTDVLLAGTAYPPDLPDVGNYDLLCWYDDTQLLCLQDATAASGGFNLFTVDVFTSTITLLVVDPTAANLANLALPLTSVMGVGAPISSIAVSPDPNAELGHLVAGPPASALQTITGAGVVLPANSGFGFCP